MAKMTRTTGTLATLALALLFALPAHAGGDGPGRDPLAIGTPMPGLEEPLQNVDGTTWTLSRAKGEKGTLVIFTCNHCPWAVAWERRLTTLGNDYREKGVGVIAISSNDPARYSSDSLDGMKVRAKKLGMAFPYAWDASSDVARAFGATKTPEAFLFDAEGRLVYRGAVDDNAEKPTKVTAHYLSDALAALLAGEPIPVKTTKAIGCTIKFRPKP